MRLRGEVTAKCSYSCSCCWSRYSACVFFILKMREGIRQPLETV
jgi:hypothetical protein